MTEPVKRCTCKEHDGPNPVAVSEFYRHPHTRDRLASWCKECVKRSNRNRDRQGYQWDPEKRRAGERRRYRADPEKFREKSRSLYWADPEKARAAKRRQKAARRAA